MSQTNTLIAISIHSLVKRETQWQHEPCLYGWHFNPLPRKEGDPDYVPDWSNEDISIHSLVKRETALAQNHKIWYN